MTHHGGRLHGLGRTQSRDHRDVDVGLAGNLIQSHAMEGAPPNRHRAPEGEVSAPMAPPHLGMNKVAQRLEPGTGLMCPSRHRRDVQETGNGVLGADQYADPPHAIRLLRSRRQRPRRRAQARDELTPPHPSPLKAAFWAAYRGRGCMSGLTAKVSRSFLQRELRLLAQGGDAGRHPARQLSEQVPPYRPRSSATGFDPHRSLLALHASDLHEVSDQGDIGMG